MTGDARTLERQRRLLRAQVNAYQTEIDKNYVRNDEDVGNGARDDNGDDADNILNRLLTCNEETLEQNLQRTHIQELWQKKLNSLVLPNYETDERIQMMSSLHTLSFRQKYFRIVGANHYVNAFEGFAGPVSERYFTFDLEVHENSASELLYFELNVSPWIRTEIALFLKTTKQANNLALCMYGLVQYSNVLVKRVQVFRQLVKDYGGHATDEKGSKIEKANPTSSVQSYKAISRTWYLDLGHHTLMWKISLNDHGRANSHIDFYKSGKLIRGFGSLADKHGIGRAVDIVLKEMPYK